MATLLKLMLIAPFSLHKDSPWGKDSFCSTQAVIRGHTEIVGVGIPCCDRDIHYSVPGFQLGVCTGVTPHSDL